MFWKEGIMVRLYRFSTKLGRWVLADYGVKSKADAYVRQGYTVKV